MRRFLLPPTLLALALLLAGAAAPPVASSDTRFRAQKLEMRNDGNDTITILTGSVEVTGTNLRITCDRLEIVSVRVGGGSDDLVARSNRFKSLVATGRVRILQPDSRREATCGRAEILPGDGRITLTDQPVLVDRDERGEAINTLKGAEMRLFRGESRVEVILPEGTATNLPDLGFETDGAAAPVPPTAPPPSIQLNLPGNPK